MSDAALPFPSRAGLPAQTVGLFLLLQLIFVRIVSTANLNYISFFGHELHWGCWFKQLTGMPCPACGMSRSVILTLHGHFGQALQMNAAGPFAVLGLVITAAGLVFLGTRQTSSGESSTRLKDHLRVFCLVYSSALLAIVLANWITKILA